jgi:hypothetical protein
MKAKRSPVAQEPIGIVISPGATQDVTPARFAYVWAPPPEETGEEKAGVDLRVASACV